MATKKAQAVSVRIEAPVLVAQAPEGIKDWGPYQFPAIGALPDGRLHASYHLQADSARAYGSETGHAYSRDAGRSWAAGDPIPGRMHINLPHGEILGISTRQSVDVAALGRLPTPLGETVVYKSHIAFYKPGDIDSKHDGYWFYRRAAGAPGWTEEKATVEDPGLIRWVAEGVLTIPCFWNMRLAPDGTLWGVHYGMRMRDGVLDRYSSAQFYVSKDGGRSWRFLSDIPYGVDPADDPMGDKRHGFTEPDLAFLPDGSLFVLLRTTDGLGIGPSYFSRSRDGLTWTRPRRFDDRGVWPRLLTMRCGVTLAVYGRTGFFLRATARPDAGLWDERIPIVPPGEYQTDTCSYGDLVATGDDTAVVIHSAFQWPNAEGKPCKTILTRRIEVKAR